MQETKSFLELQNRGSVLFIYSDRLKVYVIYHDLEGHHLYKFVCDKQLIVESVHELEVPEKFLLYREIHWYKPLQNPHNNCFIFSGSVVLDDKKTHTFKINDVDELVLSEDECTPNVFSLLPMDSLKDVEVEFHIQKSNKLYAIGYHAQTHEQLFLLIDIATDKVLRKYTLHSGMGEVIANTINIDRVDARVYVGGLIRDPQTRVTVQPFFESFLLI